jgi:hypothetical protein
MGSLKKGKEAADGAGGAGGDGGCNRRSKASSGGSGTLLSAHTELSRYMQQNASLQERG